MNEIKALVHHMGNSRRPAHPAGACQPALGVTLHPAGDSTRPRPPRSEVETSIINHFISFLQAKGNIERQETLQTIISPSKNCRCIAYDIYLCKPWGTLLCGVSHDGSDAQDVEQTGKLSNTYPSYITAIHEALINTSPHAHQGMSD